MKENIKTQQLSEAISERYLSYALSTIVARSLPDVRDGLKPVHRRILYGMRMLKLDPKSGFKKCARVVGDVMGKYHPHGDASIYDAMVRLAQSFSVRYPLVVGQGNFGNVDGDSAAAMRYTEAKLSAAAVAIMDGLDENTVDFMDTYSGEEVEPAVMPAGFPNLLANGANGIAVGMATNIPPHNILELCDGICALIRKPSSSVAELCAHIRGPDFPTGGVLNQTRESIAEAYASGRGGFVLRAKWKREDLPYANYQIVITEIPYQVPKSRLIEKIADLMEAGRLPLIGDIRDESAEDVKIVVEPKSRASDSAIIMAQLFALTDLQVKFGLNMNVLDKAGVPRVMNLKEALQAYVDHRVEVLTRRSEFRAGNIKRRLEILDGYLAAYLNLDAVIKIIRENDEPKPILMSKFKLSDVQAEAILNMRLRSLRKLEETEIKLEAKSLRAELKELKALLGDDKAKLKRISDDTKAMRAEFAKDKKLSRRMTEIDVRVDENPAPLESFMPKDPITVIMSQMGWIKAMKGHVDLASAFAFKEGDSLAFALHATTADRIIVAASSGQFFALEAGKIASGRGYGDAIRVLLAIPAEADIIDLFAYKPDARVLLASDAGYGFIAKAEDLLASTRNGRQAMNVGAGGRMAVAHEIAEGDNAAVVSGSNRSVLVFPLLEIPEMARGKGVQLAKYKEPRARLCSATTFKKSEGFSWTSGRRAVNSGSVAKWSGHRAGAGKPAPEGFPRNGKFE
ncbi:MAG: DNA topoisomerase IV subunit A [Rickettsiales bacterium]|jgi:topoisomerase-4 subunit A|nr:DNA topoisomerase IV subunit A [Rickettsiales bacterium]